MKFYSFQIVIEKEPEDQGFFAYSPDLPGCFSNGMTAEEAAKNFQEAVKLHLEAISSRASTPAN